MLKNYKFLLVAQILMLATVAPVFAMGDQDNKPAEPGDKAVELLGVDSGSSDDDKNRGEAAVDLNRAAPDVADGESKEAAQFDDGGERQGPAKPENAAEATPCLFCERVHSATDGGESNEQARSEAKPRSRTKALAIMSIGGVPFLVKVSGKQDAQPAGMDADFSPLFANQSADLKRAIARRQLMEAAERAAQEAKEAESTLSRAEQFTGEAAAQASLKRIAAQQARARILAFERGDSVSDEDGSAYGSLVTSLAIAMALLPGIDGSSAPASAAEDRVWPEHVAPSARQPQPDSVGLLPGQLDRGLGRYGRGVSGQAAPAFAERSEQNGSGCRMQ